MPDGGGPFAPPVTAARGRIGPNAVTQLLALIEATGGEAMVAAMLSDAGIGALPDLTEMIDEDLAARLHQALRAARPDLAPILTWAAGDRTAEYILAHRIPKPVQSVLRALPAFAAGPILARAIAQHAWTFAGSGAFRVVTTRPMTFEIADNPVVRGEVAGHPVCDWHASVFETLFRRLVSRKLRARETRCCAMGAPACRFVLTRVA